MPAPNLWIVGNMIERKEGAPHATWEFLGVFDSEDRAREACTSKAHFIAPATLNERIPDEPLEWEGAFYPFD